RRVLRTHGYALGPYGGAMAVTAPVAPAALSARGIVKSFGGRRVLDGLDPQLPAPARGGLIGPTGPGRRAPLRPPSGGAEAPAGAVTLRRGAVVAHLSQLVSGDERTVRETVRDARPDVAALEADLARVEAQLADPALASDLDRMGRVLENQARLLERREA